jgi:phosphonate transport system substrate-binding protein
MKRSFVLFVVLLLAVAVILTDSGFGNTSTSAQGDDLGTPGNPIQVFFVPSAEAQTLIEGGEVLADALTEATGLSFEVSVPTSYAATIEAMCAAPGESMGFIPAAGYVIGNDRCGIEVHAAAVRYGWPFYWAQYIARRDSDIYVMGDLDGKTWAYPDRASTSGFVVPSAEMQAMNVTPGDEVEAGGHNQAVLAVYNGEADFATTYFSPPLMPGASWSVQDVPEPFNLTESESYVTDDGDLYVGGVRILDARSAVAEQAPDIMDEVGIIAISAPIPNDTMSFGPDFPPELRDQLYDALVAFSETDRWGESALGSDQGYSWTSLQKVDDSAFDPVRQQFEVLNLTEKDIFEED